MTKTIGIYAAQILLGVIALAAGYAKLTGAGFMVQQFQMLGVGQGFLMVAGAAEIVAGLCLLLPRGGIVGALLLTCVMVGALGVTIGHVASTAAAPAQAVNYKISNTQAAASYDAASYDAAIVRTIQRKAEWSI
jgi:uncharacterized membrane protein YphA (DoxX/SURF4 family)